MALGAPQLSICAEESNLPPELADYVIDSLHDDRASLLACTLVSHSWLPSNRLHLFSRRRIRVRTPQLSDFLEWTRSCGYGPQHVRTVRFYGGDSGHIPIMKTALVDPLTCMPRIESLMFVSVRFEREGGAKDPSESNQSHRDHRKDAPIRRFALKELQVARSCDTDSRFFNLATCLGIFQSIGRLDIRSMKSLGVQAMTLLASSLPPFDKFLIRRDTSIPIVRIYALTMASTTHFIQSLDIVSDRRWNPSKVGVLLRHIGGGLRRLRLNLLYLPEPPDIVLLCTQLNLSACIRLEQLSVFFALGLSLGQVSPHTIARILDAIPRSTVQTVSLSLHADPDSATAIHSRDALDDALSHFSALRQLIVHVRGAPTPGSESRRVWKAWPLTTRNANVVVTAIWG